jgi:hypothetical protein
MYRHICAQSKNRQQHQQQQQQPLKGVVSIFQAMYPGCGPKMNTGTVFK